MYVSSSLVQRTNGDRFIAALQGTPRECKDEFERADADDRGDVIGYALSFLWMETFNMFYLVQSVWRRAPLGEESYAHASKVSLTVEGGDHLTLLNVNDQYLKRSLFPTEAISISHMCS